MTAGAWLIVAVFIGLGAAAVHWHFFGEKCPACGRTHAIDKTGFEKGGAGFLVIGQEEWRCKYCGHRMWKIKVFEGGARFGGNGGNGG